MYITIAKGDFEKDGIKYSYKYEINSHNKFKHRLTIVKPKEFKIYTKLGRRIWPLYPYIRKSCKLIELHTGIPKDMNDIVDKIISDLRDTHRGYTL